jgi:hypothetical protein
MSNLVQTALLMSDSWIKGAKALEHTANIEAKDFSHIKPPPQSSSFNRGIQL